jgi:hypothetical protein
MWWRKKEKKEKKRKKSLFIHSDGRFTSVDGKQLIALKVHWIQCSQISR